MNSIFAFCIIGVILMQDAALGQFTGLTRLRNTVNSVNNDITRYKSNLRFNLGRKLSNLKIVQLTNVNNVVNPSLSDVRNSIDAAKEAGKDAAHCYEPARKRMADSSKATYSALDKCESDQLDALRPIEQNIDSLLTTGRLLLSNIQSIEISCTSGNALQAQLCIAQNLPSASQTVQNFQNTANLLKNSGDSVSSSGETNAASCFQTPMNQLYADVSSAQISATNCVREATK